MKKSLKRLADWAHWPFGLFYFPLFAAWLGYCLRSRSLWFFSPSNPTIPFGGFEGERKMDIYAQLPEDLYPRTICIEPGLSSDALLSLVEEHGFRVPFVVKPDVGMEGLLFKKITHLDQLVAYHAAMPVPYLVQEFVGSPVEVSVFYYRRPDRATGTISGFIQKKLGPALIGNRMHGAIFTDLSQHINRELTKQFDMISRRCSFFYGRYDIKCESVDAIASGRGFTILEFNGAGSIPNHVYAGSYNLFGAYREIVRHWRILYLIARTNLKKGSRYPGLFEGWQYLRNAKKHFRNLRRIKL